jgi:hypothetical protein
VAPWPSMHPAAWAPRPGNARRGADCPLAKPRAVGCVMRTPEEIQKLKAALHKVKVWRKVKPCPDCGFPLVSDEEGDPYRDFCPYCDVDDGWTRSYVPGSVPETHQILVYGGKRNRFASETRFMTSTRVGTIRKSSLTTS